MSFLGNGRGLEIDKNMILNLKLLKKYHKKPSPTFQNIFPGSAQCPECLQDGKYRLPQKFRFLERISLLISPGKWIEGSMTVEAAVVLPLLLFFLLNLSCVIELIRLHGNLQLALWDTGTKLAIYGHALEDTEISSLFSVFYIKTQVMAHAGEEYLDQAPIKGGAGGISFWKNETGATKDELDLIMTYPVAPWISMAGFGQFRMANRYYAHIWNGYEIPGASDSEQPPSEIVYVAENGKVYHTSKDCTHLKLSVRAITQEEADGLKNQWGKPYDPCEKCGRGNRPGTLYVTEDGQRYHYKKDCPGLKRTVYAVPREDVPDYPCCSRCEMRDGVY